MDRQLPTSGQLERELSQKIFKLYRQKLEHSPQKITCNLFENQLAIVIEKAMTAVEKTLMNRGYENKIVKSTNLAIKKLIKPKFKAIVEEVLLVEADDILYSSNLKTERVGIIIILSQPPLIRNSQPNPKIKGRKNN